ncbi:MAG: hypothetical protein WBK96_10435 [Candidatus Manganitrophaceae bacterium]
MRQKMSSLSFLSFLFAVQFFLTPTLYAQEAAKQSPKGPPERVYPMEYDRVWDKVVEALTEKGLADHPHGKMSADKTNGKIITPTFRYFKIASAKPVNEKHYRDTYTVNVIEEASFKAREAKAKADQAQAMREEAKTKTEEAKGKSGEEAKALLDEAQEAEKEAKTLAETAKKTEEEAKALAAKPRVVKVQIQRKFELHDDAKRVWADADPNAEKIGIPEETILSALDAKLTAAPAPANTGETKTSPAKEEIKKEEPKK